MSAADDFLREIEDSNAANKTKRWLNNRATDKQKKPPVGPRHPSQCNGLLMDKI